MKSELIMSNFQVNRWQALLTSFAAFDKENFVSRAMLPLSWLNREWEWSLLVWEDELWHRWLWGILWGDNISNRCCDWLSWEPIPLWYGETLRLSPETEVEKRNGGVIWLPLTAGPQALPVWAWLQLFVMETKKNTFGLTFEVAWVDVDNARGNSFC